MEETSSEGKTDKYEFKIPPLQMLTISQWIVSCADKEKAHKFKSERKILNTNYTKLEPPKWIIFQRF